MKVTLYLVESLLMNYIIMQIIDLATLTGACIVALGPSIAGKYYDLFLKNYHKMTCLSSMPFLIPRCIPMKTKQTKQKVCQKI